ncbi:MAG: DUF3467 domain-containing protein [Vicinamibacterales bacterium]|nr:DUF3467 domain-containing protein [Vicinamibacterales bacterium]
MSKDKDSQPIETISAGSDQQQIQLQIDDSETPIHYCSTARVWGTAEEINVDFAGPVRATNQPKIARLKIDNRVVLNPWAAKRLALALGQAVARHEQTYGVLELDERKRRVSGDAGLANPGSGTA